VPSSRTASEAWSALANASMPMTAVPPVTSTLVPSARPAHF
jgi:hypothetical protein